jgi:plastocyanin/mono/diheme cytochrome c family protein
MNTSKQVNVMVGLMFVFLVGTFLYFLWDQVRAEDAEDKQIVENAERGGRLFSLNCRSCHGINGLGALENSNLPGAPLNVEGNRPVGDPGALLNLQNRFRDTIRCGRIGTLMPPWAEDQGGALNPFQIEQLVALITGAMPGLPNPDDPNAVSEKGWEAALEEAEHADLLEGKKLKDAVSASETTFVLTDAQKLTIDGFLRIGEEVVLVVDAPQAGALGESISEDDTELAVEGAGDLFAAGDTVQVGQEKMRVLSVSADEMEVERGVDDTDAADHRGESSVFEPGVEIEVERGAFSTEAAEHEEGAQVYNGPLAPPEGPRTGEDGTPPCGQLAPQPAASPAAPVPVEGTVAMEMQDNVFVLNGTNNPTLSVAAGAAVTINLTNNGAAVHNLRTAGADAQLDNADDHVSEPDVVPAGATAVLQFSFDTAGTYQYRCDFHPVDMTGEIVVQ